MTLEQEVRSFASKYIPNGAGYLADIPVPLFGFDEDGLGHTWEDVFSGKVSVPEKTQRAVLKRLRDLFGNRQTGRSF